MAPDFAPKLATIFTPQKKTTNTHKCSILYTQILKPQDPKRHPNQQPKPAPKFQQTLTCTQICRQICTQIGAQICTQIRTQIRTQICTQICTQTRTQMPARVSSNKGPSHDTQIQKTSFSLKITDALVTLHVAKTIWAHIWAHIWATQFGPHLGDNSGQIWAPVPGLGMWSRDKWTAGLAKQIGFAGLAGRC